MQRVAIIGTGLIGGSVGLGLKAAKISDLEIVGFDESSTALSAARKRGAIDVAVGSLDEAVAGARMTIIATPALAARGVLQDIAGKLEAGSIVTDTLSTKAEIMLWARETLPDQVSYVGGHPMAGKATSAGVDESEATLFNGHAYAVVPSPEAGEGAVQSVVGLANALGAEPVFMQAEEHDQYVAAVSHLPMVLSYALFSLVRESTAWQDMRQLAGTGFAGATRLASGDPHMTHDICATNGEALIHWIDRFIEELRQYRGMIADDPAELFKALAAAQLKRDAYLAGADKPQMEEIDLPSASEQMSSIMFGSFLTNRYKEYEKRMRAAEEREQKRNPR
jgi:prephenate dehydrogenase